MRICSHVAISAVCIVILILFFSPSEAAVSKLTCIPNQALLCVTLSNGRLMSVRPDRPGPDFPLQGQVVRVRERNVVLSASTFSNKPVTVAFSPTLKNQRALLPGHRVSFDFHPASHGQPAWVRVNDGGAVAVARHARPGRVVAAHHTRSAPAHQARVAAHAAPRRGSGHVLADAPWCDALVEQPGQGSAVSGYTGRVCKVPDHFSGRALLAWASDQDLQRKMEDRPRLMCATPEEMQTRAHGSLPPSIPCAEVKKPVCEERGTCPKPFTPTLPNLTEEGTPDGISRMPEEQRLGR